MQQHKQQSVSKANVYGLVVHLNEMELEISQHMIRKEAKWPSLRHMLLVLHLCHTLPPRS